MSESSAAPPDPRRTAVMTVLTVLAGAVDAVSFLTMGNVFCALATGNVLFLSFALAGEGDVPVARPATAIGAFLVGAGVGAVVLMRVAARGRSWFAVGLAGEGLLLALGGAVAVVRHGDGAAAVDGSDLVVVGAVALAMGLRAATALRLDVPGMPTLLSQTAVARLVSDVLKEPRAALRGMSRRQRLARTRWTATVTGIFAGGVLGTLLLVPLGTGRALFVVAAVALLLAAAHLAVPPKELREQRKRREQGKRAGPVGPDVP
ncbi:YoaK family protein [Streptomyces sp. AC512_CC834]|uniref:YoaK family protein n=1 Tax=Streptomyces sp. AC512_CC834 TaxID=2823691 RepID=UPI001C26DED4|nr:YoaK family protein [Streptomyces sp. AC512_CC834]